MSFAPSYDPNCASMMPSPNRGKRNPRFSSPRQQFSPGGEQNSFQQSPHNNRGRGFRQVIKLLKSMTCQPSLPSSYRFSFGSSLSMYEKCIIYFTAY